MDTKLTRPSFPDFQIIVSGSAPLSVALNRKQKYIRTIAIGDFFNGLGLEVIDQHPKARDAPQLDMTFGLVAEMRGASF